MLFKRFIQAALMPSFIVGIQLFFQFLFGKEIFGIGIPLSAVALAQLFPYLFFDNLVLLKVFTLSTKFDENKSGLNTNYLFEIKKNTKEILFLRNMTIALFIIVLSLFIITLGLESKVGYHKYHNYTGIASVLLSLGYSVFA